MSRTEARKAVSLEEHIEVTKGAENIASRMQGYMKSDAFAGPYLADQMLLPFALAGGGSFTTVKPSQHARTGANIISKFTGRVFRFDQQENGLFMVTSD